MTSNNDSQRLVTVEELAAMIEDNYSDVATAHGAGLAYDIEQYVIANGERINPATNRVILTNWQITAVVHKFTGRPDQWTKPELSPEIVAYLKAHNIER